MFSRSEASRIREEFWTAFGRYMHVVPSAEGSPVNWVNYHTKVKDVFFRMNAGPKQASIFIALEQRDAELQQLFFEQLLQFKAMLHATLEEEWRWEAVVEMEGRMISRVVQELKGVSVYNREDWPTIISFLKPRIIALDAFWENAKYTFMQL